MAIKKPEVEEIQSLTADLDGAKDELETACYAYGDAEDTEEREDARDQIADAIREVIRTAGALESYAQKVEAI